MIIEALPGLLLLSTSTVLLVYFIKLLAGSFNRMYETVRGRIALWAMKNGHFGIAITLFDENEMKILAEGLKMVQRMQHFSDTMREAKRKKE